MRSPYSISSKCSWRVQTYLSLSFLDISISSSLNTSRYAFLHILYCSYTLNFVHLLPSFWLFYYQHIIILFTPSSKYANRFLTRLVKFISPLHTIQLSVLSNNLTNLIVQVLFTFILSDGIPKSICLHSQYVLMMLNGDSLRMQNQGERSSFLRTLPSAVYKVTDKLCLKGEEMNVNATCMLIQWFALYLSNSDLCWPWMKWWVTNRYW